MASMENSDADRMASCIQELLLQDQSRQRAALENLSKYTGEKLGAEAPSQDSAPWKSFGDQGEAATAAAHCLQLPKAPGLPGPSGVDIPLPGKLSSNKATSWPVPEAAEPAGQKSGSNPQAAVAARHRLQQASQVLQSALANWEACVAESSSAVPGDAVTVVEQMVSQLQQGGMDILAAQDRSSGPPGLSSTQALSAGPSRGSAPAAAMAANGESLEKAANLLEKALFDLNRHLPAETAQMAHSLLEGVNGTPEGSLPNTEEQDKLKWLAHYLESQNKVSIERLSKLLQDPAPMRPQAGAAAAFGQQGTAAAAAAIHQAWRMPPSSQAALAAAQMGAGGASNLWANAVHHGLGGLPLAAAQGVTGSNAYLAASTMGGGGGAAAPKWPWGAAGAESGGLHAAAAAALASGGIPEMRKGGGPKKRNTMAQGGGAQAIQGAPPPEQTGETLRMHLRSLLHVESSRVLIVRKINRLSFSSPAILKEHFSWYGNVEQVLVAHSRVKSGSGQAGIVSRLRPSGLGFVVMSQTVDAEAILAQGPEQQVCGTLIRVQKFERRMAMEDGDDAEEEKTEGVFAGDARALGA